MLCGSSDRIGEQDMEPSQFGELLQLEAGEADASERESKIGSDWEVSENARRRIERIEATIRAAEARSVGLIIR